MRYIALATDYDGTIAHDGKVSPATIAALKRVHASGRKLLLVTGRLLPDLLRVFPHIELFDRVVVENGALLYNPGTKRKRLLTGPASTKLFEALKQKRVPVENGEGVISTVQPHENTVLELIRNLGVELHVAFNKGAVMILPPGVNKGTGLCKALEELRLSPHNLVGIGDAENDHAFLSRCACAVAVANAIPSLKKQVDIVTKAPNGRGVVELINHLLANDLINHDARRMRRKVSLPAD
jgi:hydroxymethylpyrimidine pyrophosphatase-like HAD family hydrolase